MLNISRQFAKISVSAIQQQPLQLQQARTKVHVTVLKRKYPVLPHKKGFKPRHLGHKQYIYENVSFATEGKDEPLELILTQFVEGLGKRGDKVSVKRHFGYNSLILPKLAVYRTPESENILGTTEKSAFSEVEFSSKEVPKIITYLSRRTLDICMNKEQPWTIEPWHIRASARKAAVIIKDESCIEMPPEKISGPDLNLEGKEFYVTITINKKEKVNVRCCIHHWSTEPGDRIQSENPWFKRAEPVFPEQAAVLDNIPLPIEKPKLKKIVEFK